MEVTKSVLNKAQKKNKKRIGRHIFRSMVNTSDPLTINNLQQTFKSDQL